ncbi:hypothetical protein SAMN04488111_1848 [Lutibacter flavus]|uniref:Uncharacterized protein n=2 Tax=Lutibacter flavus TaxID=691689 RepID=A0A238XHY7_9FLAO|nr:hypothetical protein SAMN04488111_1848 [Lutibacter flavus]
MRIILLIIAASFTLFSCKTETKKVEENLQTTEAEAAEIPLLALGEFDAKAGAFVNKEVQIQGIVDHVCKHSGKKLLVVTDDGDVHITSDVRFEDSLKGSEILLTGVVVEERIDESYCLKMEEDNIKSHSEGASNQEQFNNKKKHIQQLRDQMKAENVDHISNYSLKYVSHNDVDLE